MYSHSTSIRVHYALTDQMGVVYHGHYAQFFEIARTEAIRALGFTYKELEAMGIIMPVVELHTRFLRPIRYDELINVTVSLHELPEHHKVVFHGEIHNEAGELCSTGTVSLFFLESKTMKRAIIPEPLLKVLAPFYNK